MKPTTLALHAVGIALVGGGIYSLTQSRWGKGIALFLAGISTHGLARMTAAPAQPAAGSQLGSLVVIP